MEAAVTSPPEDTAVPAGTSLQRAADGEREKCGLVCGRGALFGLENMDWRKQLMEVFFPKPVKQEQKI